MQDFFESDPLSETQAEFQHIKIILLMEFWQEIRAEIGLHQWSEEQGLRYLLVAGLAALSNQQQSESLPTDGSVLRAVIQEIQHEQVHLFGRYAEVRHSAAELKMTVTNMEAQLKACKTQVEILRKVNAELLAGLMSRR